MPTKPAPPLTPSQVLDLALSIRGGQQRLASLPADVQMAVGAALRDGRRLAQHARDRAATARSRDDRTRFTGDRYLDRTPAE